MLIAAEEAAVTKFTCSQEDLVNEAEAAARNRP